MKLGFSSRPSLPGLALRAVLAPGLARGGYEPSTGYQCTVSAVACGAYVTTSTETETCGVIELADLGKLPDKEYTQVTFFAGGRVGGEVLFLGGGSAKLGVVITCKVPWGDGKKAPDYDRLKKELPALLKSNPAIQKRFPKLTKVEVDKDLKFKPLKPADIEALKEAYPKAGIK